MEILYFPAAIQPAVWEWELQVCLTKNNGINIQKVFTANNTRMARKANDAAEIARVKGCGERLCKKARAVSGRAAV